jgi:hypothetical protein
VTLPPVERIEFGHLNFLQIGVKSFFLLFYALRHKG